MITTIAHKERLEMIRDGRFRLAATVTGGLLLFALVLGVVEYRTVTSEAERASMTSWTQWVEQGEKNPHSAAHFSLYAYRPVSPLAFIEPGVTPYTGLAVWLEAHYQNEFSFRPARDAASVGRLGRVTASLVLQVLLPLVIVLLTFGSFASEAESGTLRQIHAQGVRARDLALGKSLGVVQALAVILVPSVLAGVVALMLTSGSVGLGDGLARLALLSLSYGLYLGAFTGLGLAFSAYARTARGALVGLIGCWVLVTLVLPRVFTDVARSMYPTPSTQEFWSAVDHDLAAGIDGHNPSDQRREQLLEDTMRRYGVAAIEDLPVNFSGVSLQASEEYSNLIFDRRYGELWKLVGWQNQVQMLSGIFTPLMAVRSASMGLAGTDFASHRHFAESAEIYRRRLVKELNHELSTMTSANPGDGVRGRAYWASMEQFIYEPPSARWSLRKQSVSITILFLWVVATFSVTIALARRPLLTSIR